MPVEDLLRLYNARRGEFGWWLDAVRSAFDKVASAPTRKVIHSVRARLKDREHLSAKLDRKRREGRTITAENLFDQIEDIAGVRVITLYRRDLHPVHDFITTTRCWTIIGEPNGYACLPEDIAYLRELGLDPREPERGYTSVHYIVGPADPNQASWLRCEIQVRSLHLEGWAEVDHQLRYPDAEPGPVAREVLRALHDAASVTDRLAHIAREASQWHARMADEIRAKDEAADKLKEEVQSLSKRLATMKARDAEHQKQLAEARADADRISSLLPRATATTPGFISSLSGRRRCDHCGFEETIGSSWTFGGRSPIKTCAHCGKSFCGGCGALDPLGIHVRGGALGFVSPLGLVSAPGRSYNAADLCKDCGYLRP